MQQEGQGTQTATLKLKRMGVQWLALILPASEQNVEEEQPMRRFIDEAKGTAVL